MNQFCIFFNAFSVTIAIITNILPTTTIIINTVTTTDAIIMCAGEYPLGYQVLNTTWLIVVSFGAAVVFASEPFVICRARNSSWLMYVGTRNVELRKVLLKCVLIVVFASNAVVVFGTILVPVPVSGPSILPTLDLLDARFVKLN
jgi:hypothetical protein